MGQTTTDPVAGTAIDKTIIQDNVTERAGGKPLIKLTSVLGQTYRVSGFTFQRLGTDDKSKWCSGVKWELTCGQAGSLSFPANARSGYFYRNHGRDLWSSGS